MNILQNSPHRELANRLTQQSISMLQDEIFEKTGVRPTTNDLDWLCEKLDRVNGHND